MEKTRSDYSYSKSSIILGLTYDRQLLARFPIRHLFLLYASRIYNIILNKQFHSQSYLHYPVNKPLSVSLNQQRFLSSMFKLIVVLLYFSCRSRMDNIPDGLDSSGNTPSAASGFFKKVSDVCLSSTLFSLNHHWYHQSTTSNLMSCEICPKRCRCTATEYLDNSTVHPVTSYSFGD